MCMSCCHGLNIKTCIISILIVFTIIGNVNAVCYICMLGRLHHRKLGATDPKKFQGGRFDVEPGGNVAATDIIDTFAQCSSKLQNMLGVHCALSACGDNN